MANKKIIPVVDALKELYGKLGGTPADVEDISTTTEIIQEITEVASPGGGGGGENSSLLLTYAYGESGFSCDKTPSEILTAINNKKQILAYLGEGSAVEAPFVQLVASGGGDITGIDITFFHYSFETNDDGTALQIEAIGLRHDVESESVTLRISSGWEIPPQE